MVQSENEKRGKKATLLFHLVEYCRHTTIECAEVWVLGGRILCRGGGPVVCVWDELNLGGNVTIITHIV